VDGVMITLFHNMIEWVKKAILLIRAIIGRYRRNTDNTHDANPEAEKRKHKSCIL
jgi:hypothetical protein